MENRKSLILHFDSLDVIDELTDEQIAQLFKAIRNYNLGKEVILDGLMKAIFIPFKNQFDRDLEKYRKKCDTNAQNGKKGGRPKQTQENPVGYFETETIPDKAYNDSDSKSDSKKVNDNKKDNIIISKEITETSSELVIDKRKNDINEMQDIIKQKVTSLGLIYKSGKQERNRIQNILTGKEFGEICEKSNMSREQFVVSIIELSTKLDFWNGKIYNGETLYSHYAKVYNEAVKVKSNLSSKKGVGITTI